MINCVFLLSAVGYLLFKTFFHFKFYQYSIKQQIMFVSHLKNISLTLLKSYAANFCALFVGGIAGR